MTPSAPGSQRPPRSWIPSLGALVAGVFAWTIVGLAFAGQHYLTSAKVGVPVPWKGAIAGALADWYVFGLLSLPAALLAQIFRLAGPHWRLRLVLHLVAGAVFSLLWILLRTLLAKLVVPLRGAEQPFHEVLGYVLVATFFFNMLVYWVIVTGTHARAYYESFRDRERRVLELESRLTAARLETLQMQLNPHFLFNALNGISTLMYRDVDTADAMLVKLANLLRHALDRSREQTVRLRDELHFIDAYLDLEQMRFGDRLKIVRNIDNSALDVQVPNLILQPLVENALKHGLSKSTRPGILTLRVVLRPDHILSIEVEDNGAGLPGNFTALRNPGLSNHRSSQPPIERASGVGLGNCLARLEELYGARASLQLRNSTSGPGAIAEVHIPL